MKEGRVIALIPAAGKGERMNRSLPKQFLPLEGKPILHHTLQVFVKSPSIEGIVLVVDKDMMKYVRENLLLGKEFEKIEKVVEGGKSRQESVYRGLKSIKNCEIVVIHDAVRPFLNQEILEEAIRKAREEEAVITAIPLQDTLKEVGKKGVQRTLNRENLWKAQTPQVFKYSLILEAHEKARKEGYLGTDDASLVERLGKRVGIVVGSPLNIKITTSLDLLLAEAILKEGKW